MFARNSCAIAAAISTRQAAITAMNGLPRAPSAFRSLTGARYRSQNAPAAALITAAASTGAATASSRSRMIHGVIDPTGRRPTLDRKLKDDTISEAPAKHTADAPPNVAPSSTSLKLLR